MEVIGNGARAALAPDDLTVAGSAEPARGAGARDEVAYLSAIIAVQTEIARAGLDLDVVMDLVARRAQELTRAGGGAVEMLDGGDMVYRAGSGAARHSVGTVIPAATSLS